MTQVNYYETFQNALKKETPKEELKELAIEALKQVVKKALGRSPEKNITNALINEVLGAYKSIGMNSLVKIIVDLYTIKGAKSTEELVYNIINNLRAGTRSDRSVLDLEDITI